MTPSHYGRGKIRRECETQKMPKLEKRVFLFLQILVIAGGALLTGYSWSTTISDLPPLIQDWRVGIGLGIVIAFVGGGWMIYDLFRNYVWWAEPVINLSTERDSKYMQGRSVEVAYLNVYNSEEKEITDCYATLEVATNLYGEDMTPINLESV